MGFVGFIKVTPSIPQRRLKSTTLKLTFTPRSPHLKNCLRARLAPTINRLHLSGAAAVKWSSVCWPRNASSADRKRALPFTTSVSWQTWLPRDGRSSLCGRNGWRPDGVKHSLSVDAATKRSTMGNTMGKLCGVKVTGEPHDTETVKRGSERGRWKSTWLGNSLAAYSTSRKVLRGPWGETPIGYSPGFPTVGILVQGRVKFFFRHSRLECHVSDQVLREGCFRAVHCDLIKPARFLLLPLFMGCSLLRSWRKP